MKSVLFLTKYPTPYRQEFFRQLGKLYKLTVLFEQIPEDQLHRNSEWFSEDYSCFEAVFLNCKKIAGKKVSTEVIRYLKDCSCDFIVIGGYALPTEMLAIQYLKRHKLKYYIEIDGILHKDGSLLKEKIKSHFIKGAYGYFSSGAPSDSELVRFGAKPERIIRSPFSSLNKQDIPDSCPSAEEKSSLRSKLDIHEKFVVLYAASFRSMKGIDLLLEAAIELSPEIGMYIIGGTPTKEYSEFINKNNLTHVHFIPFLSKEALCEYYKAADCFVHPSKSDVWGLVVNEAMAHGLPIIGSDHVGAVLALVRDGINGYVFQSGDSSAISRLIIDFFNNRTLMITMSKNSLETIKDYSIENMVKAHADEFERPVAL